MPCLDSFTLIELAGSAKRLAAAPSSSPIKVVVNAVGEQGESNSFEMEVYSIAAVASVGDFSEDFAAPRNHECIDNFHRFRFPYRST